MTFLNFTIHPSDSWQPPQREAAEALVAAMADDPAEAEVDIVDYPFPIVDPGADSQQIDLLADEIVADLFIRFDSSELVVHLMGEFTLTCALVARLQGEGVRVVASTTDRIVARGAGGQTTRTFSFRRFRDYPPLYAEVSEEAPSSPAT